MEILTAKQARIIVEETKNISLNDVLSQIKQQAKYGKSQLHVCEPLSKEILSSLKNLGYDIPPASRATVHKGSLHHIIHWK